MHRVLIQISTLWKYTLGLIVAGFFRISIFSWTTHILVPAVPPKLFGSADCNTINKQLIRTILGQPVLECQKSLGKYNKKNKGYLIMEFI